MQPTYGWSPDPEMGFEGEYPSREEALFQARIKRPSGDLYTCRNRPLTHSDVCPVFEAETVLCQAGERLETFTGVYDDPFDNLTIEAAADLEKRFRDAFLAWAKEHELEVSHLGVEDIELHEEGRQ